MSRRVPSCPVVRPVVVVVVVVVVLCPSVPSSSSSVLCPSSVPSSVVRFRRLSSVRRPSRRLSRRRRPSSVRPSRRPSKYYWQDVAEASLGRVING